MAEKPPSPQPGDKGNRPVQSTSTIKNGATDEKDCRKIKSCEAEEVRSNNQPIASVKRKLKTLTFGRRYKSGASKDGSKKKRKGTWAFKFKNRLKCTAEPDIAEPTVGCNSCICTGYRRTEEHHLGAGIVFSATPPAGRKLMAHPHPPSETKVARRGPIIDLLKFNPDDYPIEDWDEQLRAQRAREMQEGIEPPPGFIVSTNPAVNNVIAPIVTPNIVINNSPPNPIPLDTLDTDFRIISLATAFQNHVSLVPFRNLDSLTVTVSSLSREVEFLSQFARATAEAVWLHRTAVHTQVDYIHCLVPDLLDITNCSFYWGKMDRYEAERLLENKPEGTFLLRDSAQEEYLFSVSFRRYGRSLHARIEQWNHKFSFDSHDPGVFASNTVCGLIEHYKDPSCCMFFEPMLTIPLHRTFPFSLQHLCRAVTCNNTTYDGINKVNLPKCLKIYLKEYHYKQRVRVRRLEMEP